MLSSIRKVLPSLLTLSIGFGPISGIIWDEYDGKLYQPYNKRDRIGKVCDFVSGQLQTTQVGAVGTTTANVVRQQKAQATAAAAKELLFDEDEKGFEVVEEETVIKKKTKTMTGGQGANTYQRGRPQQGYWQNRGSQPGRGGNQRGGN